MSTLSAILDERHKRRLAKLALFGATFAATIRVLGGTPEGQEPTPAELERGFARLGHWSGRRFTVGDLDMPDSWIRLGRVIGLFDNFRRRLFGSRRGRILSR